MKHIAFRLVTALVLAIPASAAWAADLCISSETFGATNGPMVGKRFKVPPRNQCKPFNGFILGEVVTGTGCTTADGALLRIHFTAHSVDSEFAQIGLCNFALPAMTTGNCRETRMSAVSFSHDDVTFVDGLLATAALCSVAVP